VDNSRQLDAAAAEDEVEPLEPELDPFDEDLLSDEDGFESDLPVELDDSELDDSELFSLFEEASAELLAAARLSVR
jgi:hypothetical protein